MPSRYDKENAVKFKKSNIRPHERITVIGKTGSGKSVLFDNLLDYFSKKTLVILIDTKDEYKHISEFQMENLKADKGLFKIVELDYKGQKIDDYYIIVEFFSLALFERGKTENRSSMLAIEELGNVVKKHGRLYDVSPSFARLLQQGRAHDVGFLGTTQRPQEIHTTILSQSNHIICFDLTSKHDLDAVKAYFEPEWIYDLGKHQFLHLDYTHNTITRNFKLYLSNDKIKFYNRLFGKP